PTAGIPAQSCVPQRGNLRQPRPSEASAWVRKPTKIHSQAPTGRHCLVPARVSEPAETPNRTSPAFRATLAPAAARRLPVAVILTHGHKVSKIPIPSGVAATEYSLGPWPQGTNEPTARIALRAGGPTGNSPWREPGVHKPPNRIPKPRKRGDTPGASPRTHRHPSKIS